MAADAETVPVGDEMMASKNEVDRPEDAIAAVDASSAPSGGGTTAAAAETADLPEGSSAGAPQGDGTSKKCDDKAAEKEAAATNSGACAAEAGAATEHGLEEPSTSEAPLEAPAEPVAEEPAAAAEHQEPVDPTVADAAAAQGAETRTDQAGDQADKGSLEAGRGVPAALAIDPDAGGGGGKVEDPSDTPDSKGLKREISWNTWKKPEDEEEASGAAAVAGAEGNGVEEPKKEEATKDPPGSPPEEGEAEQEAPKTASKDTKDPAAKSEAAKDGDGKTSASKSKAGSKESSKDRERGRSSGSRRRSRSRSRSRSRGDRGRDRSRERRDRSRDRRDRSRDRDRRRGSPIIRRDGRPVSPPAPRRRPDEPGPIFTRLQRGGRGGHAAWEGAPRGAPGGAFGGWDDARRGAPGMGPPFRGVAGAAGAPPGWQPRAGNSPERFNRPLRRSMSPPGAYTQMRRGPMPGRPGSPPLGGPRGAPGIGGPQGYGGGRGAPHWDAHRGGPPGHPGGRGGGPGMMPGMPAGRPHSPPGMRGGFGGPHGRPGATDYGTPNGGMDPYYGRGAGMRGDAAAGDKRPRDWREEAPPGRRGPGGPMPGGGWGTPAGGEMSPHARGNPGGGWGGPGTPGARGVVGHEQAAMEQGQWPGGPGGGGGYGGGGGGPGGVGVAAAGGMPQGSPAMHGQQQQRGWSPPLESRMGGGGGGYTGMQQQPHHQQPHHQQPQQQQQRGGAGGGYGVEQPGGMQNHNHPHHLMSEADAMGIGSVEDKEWYYIDPQGETQGPCSIVEFDGWLRTLSEDPAYHDEYVQFKEVRVWKQGFKQQIPLERLVQHAQQVQQQYA